MGQGGSEPTGVRDTSAAEDQQTRIPQRRGSGESAQPAQESGRGRTTIAASVVQKIAGMAAREVSGVHSMGGGPARAVGALRERIPGGGSTSSTSGVRVEVGEKQAAVDLEFSVEYGVSILELARSVRRDVISGVEGMTGLDVVEVNISVNDVHLPEEGSHASAGAQQSAGGRVE